MLFIGNTLLINNLNFIRFFYLYIYRLTIKEKILDLGCGPFRKYPGAVELILMMIVSQILFMILINSLIHLKTMSLIKYISTTH